MADTKVSALTGISGGTLAATDEMPVADASDLTVTYSATMANVKSFCQNAPVFAAGSSSAGTWPVFTSGTLLTTAEAGAWEVDANCIYATTDAGNRGVVSVRHYIRQDATNTLTSSATEQNIFNSVTNGRITLEAGCYLFDGVIYVTSMDAVNATNAALDPVGAGTAATGSWLWYVIGRDTIGSAPTNQSATWSLTQQTAASAVTGVAGADVAYNITGTFEVTTGGTLIPSITLSTAAAAVINIGSYIAFERIGSTSVVSVGEWD